MANLKERSLMDEIKDLHAGKIRNKYYNNQEPQEYYRQTRNIPIAQPSELDNMVGVYKKSNKQTADGRDNSNTAVQKSEKKIEHGNANITGVPEYIKDRVYSGYSYSQLKAEAEKPEYKNNQPKRDYLNNKAYEKATSKDLQAEYDSLKGEYDALTSNPHRTYVDPYDSESADKAEQIASRLDELGKKLDEKKRAERAAINQEVKDKKIKDFELTRAPRDYADYLYQYENAEDEDIREWTKQKVYELATSEQLQAEYDRLMSDVGTRPDGTRDYSKVDDFGLSELIDKKKQEENEQRYYYDIVQNDVKAAIILQKYYEYNKDKPLQQMQEQAQREGMLEGAQLPYDSDKIKSLEEQFNALSEKYDTDKLLKYYGRIKEREENKQKLEQTAEWSKEHPWLASGSSVIENTVGSIPDAIKYFGAYLDKHLAGGDGYVDPNSTNVANAQAKREAVAEDWGELGQFIYSTGMSMADFISLLPLNFIPGGQAASLAVLGTSAGVSTANEVIENGGGVDKAVTSGVMSGVFESLFEKVSLEQLKAFKQSNKTDLESVIKNIFKGSFTEGTEEMFTDIANFVSDGIINADISNVSLQYKSLLEQGYSEEEAWKTCAVDFAKQLGLSFAGGALSGAAMNAGTAGINKVTVRHDLKKSSRLLGEELVSEKDFDLDLLLKQGLAADEQTSANKLAKRLTAIQEQGEEVQPIDIGNLFKLVEEEKQKSKSYSAKLEKMGGQDNSSNIEFKEMSEYPYNEKTVITDYIKATSDKVKDFVNRVKANSKEFLRLNLNKVSEKQASDIKRLTGIDVSGYTNAINSDSVTHILNRHGENGEADSSMADVNDIARVEYILNNYDDVEVLTQSNDKAILSESFMSKDNTHASLLKYSKKINGTYYVVEAVPENKWKKLWVISAYISKKNTVTQVSDVQAPKLTSESALASPVFSNSRIAQDNSAVNKNLQKSGWKGSAPSSPAVMDAVKAGTYTGDENEDFNFGEKHPNGAAAKTKDGTTILIKGIETSSRAYGEADNTIMLKTKDGELVNSDDVEFYDDKIQKLMNYVKQFDTIGARTYVSAYEQAKQDLGEKFDFADFSKGFYLFYNVGRTGVKFETLSSSGKYNAAIETVSPTATYRAVLSGNMDSDFKFKNEANAVQRVKSEKTPEGRLYVEVGTKYDLAANEDITEALQGLSSKIGVDIVISDNLSHGEAVGEFRKGEGKIYINSKVDTSYMLSIALHEAGHWLRTTSPEDFKLISDFVVNYLESKGYNVSDELDEIKQKYKDTYSDDELDTRALEELVCNSLMSIASDENAANSAIGNGKKLANALKRLVSKIREYLLNKTASYTRVYKAFVNDTEALLKLADMVGKGFENGRGVEVVSEEQGNSNYLIEDENDSDHIRLKNDDISNYLKSGNRRNINKFQALNNGEKIILTTQKEIVSYIGECITGNVKEKIKAYGKINKRLSTEILKMSNQKENLKGYYLELPSDDLFHAFKEHSKAKQSHNIPLTELDLKNIPYYLDKYDNLLYVRRYARGIARVCVSKDLENGKIIIIETISKGRGALQFKTAFGVDEEGYNNFLISNGLENKISSSNSRGDESLAITSLRDDTAYNDILSHSRNIVNSKNDTKKNNDNNDYLLYDELHNDSSSAEYPSDVRLLIDDELNDYIDHTVNESFEKVLADAPSRAVNMAVQSAVKTTERLLRDSGKVKLTDSDLQSIAQKAIKKYNIAIDGNDSYIKGLVDSIKSLINEAQNENENFALVFERFVKRCESGILLSKNLEADINKEAKAFIKERIWDKRLMLTAEEVEDIKNQYGSVKNYRNRLFGKTYVGVEGENYKRAHNEYSLSELLSEVEESYPELIDLNDVTEVEAFDALLNSVLAVKYKNPNVNGFYEDVNSVAIEAAVDISTEIAAKTAIRAKENSDVKNAGKLYNDIVKQRQNLFNAKRRSYQLQYEREINKKREKLQNLRKRFNEINESDIRQRKALREKILKLEEDNRDKKRIINNGMRSLRQEYNDNRRKTVLINKLGRKLDSFTKRFDKKAKNSEYIPDKLKLPILNVLSSFKADPGYFKNGNKKEVSASFGEWRFIQDISKNVEELTNEYKRLEAKKKSDSGDNTYIDVEALAYNENVYQALRDLSKQLSGKNIYALEVQDLEEINFTIELLDSNLKSVAQIIIDGKSVNMFDLAAQAVDEINSTSYTRDLASNFEETKLGQKIGGNKVVKSVINAPQVLAESFKATQLDPVRYGKFLSDYREDSVVYKLFKGLHEGDVKRVKIMQDSYLPLQAYTSREEVQARLKDLQTKDVEDFNFRDLDTGKRVKISQGILLSIYLTSRQKAGIDHLVGLGTDLHYTVVPELEQSIGSRKEHRILLSEQSIEEIAEYIQGDEVLNELAKIISGVLNGNLKDEINAVSMRKYGMLIATVKDYFPLKVHGDGANIEYEFETVFFDNRQKSRSFTKQREKSFAPICIYDVFEVFNRHVNSVAEYCGLLEPIENFKKVYKCGTGISLHTAIKNNYGEAAEHYINKLMGDLQNSKDFLDNTIIQKLQGNFMGAKLIMNPGAALKQLAAYPTAVPYFGYKNVVRAFLQGTSKIDLEKYEKYTSYLWYRKEGNGTVIGEISKQAGLSQKLLNTPLFGAMNKMDRRVVSSLLYAAELHVEQTTDLKKGTEAFYKEVARQFEKCIDESQPNNMVTSKPQFVRNNTLKLLSMNAFKSQSMAQANLVLDAYMEFNARKRQLKDLETTKASQEQIKAATEEKKEAAKKFYQKLFASYGASVLLGAISIVVSALAYHKWDEYKDEKGNVSVPKVLTNLLDESLQGFFDTFAWGGKAYELVSSKITGDKFYGLEVMEIDNINDLITQISRGDIVALGAHISDLAGLPGGNAQRLLTSASSYAKDFIYGGGEIITDNTGKICTSYLGRYVYEAKKKGQDDKAESYIELWTSELKKDGKSSEQIQDAIKSKLVSAMCDDEEIQAAAVAFANGDFAAYESAVDKVAGYGFDKQDVVKAVKKVNSTLVSEFKKNKTSVEDASDELIYKGYSEKGAKAVLKDYSPNGNTEEYEEIDVFSNSGNAQTYSYNDLFEAKLSGDNESYDRVYEYFKSTGKDDRQINSTLRNASRTDPIFEKYLKAVKESNRQELERYKGQLLNIYGSWSEVQKALKRYNSRKSK